MEGERMRDGGGKWKSFDMASIGGSQNNIEKDTR